MCVVFSELCSQKLLRAVSSSWLKSARQGVSSQKQREIFQKRILKWYIFRQRICFFEQLCPLVCKYTVRILAYSSAAAKVKENIRRKESDVTFFNCKKKKEYHKKSNVTFLNSTAISINHYVRSFVCTKFAFCPNSARTAKREKNVRRKRIKCNIFKTAQLFL